MNLPRFARKSFLFLLVAVMSLALGWGGTEVVRGHQWKAVGENGVYRIDTVAVRDTRQHLYIRGEKRNAPLLLFLPGGPGESFVPLAREFTGELEKAFVVVHIETGGVGKSGHYGTGPTLEQMVADTDEIVDHLLQAFGQDSLYIVGHSFGSVLGLLEASRHPGKVRAIATVGQAVDWREGNRLAYRHLQDLARSQANVADLEKLAGIPPDMAKVSDGRPAIDFSAVPVQRALLEKYGLNNIFRDHTASARWFSYLTSPAHDLQESCSLINRGPCRWIADVLWWHNWQNVIPGVLEFDALRDVPQLEMPYLAIVGSDDWITPKALVVEYEAALSAPAKRLVVIQGAQHYTFLDSPKAFQQAVLELKALVASGSR